MNGDYKMLRRIGGVEIPDDVVIPCPELKFNYRAVKKHCSKCEYYDGIGIMKNPDKKVPWHKKYVICCTFPMERRVQVILREDLS